MSEQSSFDYAMIRVVPRVEREEFVNAGVILFCLQRNFLAAQIEVDGARLQTLWPEVDIDVVRLHLEAVIRICSAQADAGPVAKLSQRERFHWLVAPRSTIIQFSPVHSGICEDPQASLDHLFQQIVLPL